MSRFILALWAMFGTTFLFSGQAGAQDKAGKGAEKGVIKIATGKEIARDWDQIQKDNNAYGPKQEYDASTGETHVYLPYGNQPELYYEVTGVLSNPTAGKCATFHNNDSHASVSLTYKLMFDKPVRSFRLSTGWTELDLAEGIAAGIEYSTDEKTWRSLVEITGPRKETMSALASDVEAKDLKAKTLFIRYYARDAKDEKNKWGENRWLQLRISGDPAWGDAQATFVKAQPQIWVKTGK